MKPHSAVVLLGIVTLAGPVWASEADRSLPEPFLRIAQASDAPANSSPPDQPANAATPGNGGTEAPSVAPPPPSASNGSPVATAPAPSRTVNPSRKAGAAIPPSSGTLRNGSVAQPTAVQSGAAPQAGPPASITYGGPQKDLQPILGSPMRDSGAGLGGVPTYSNAPSTPGGPVGGTSNAYTATLPYGSSGTTLSGSSGTGRSTQDNTTSFTRQPLGGAPNTRDQTGTFGGRAGYNAQGIYTGTATSQPGSGYGYGSAYAPIERPTGGLLSTNVDATGPLRPYIPLNNSPQGRPNSGYGVPNGSRPTHMDGRGVQRLD